MARKLECNVCKVTYTDKESIDMANKYARHMPIGSKGIAPCPIITCKGELVLIKFVKMDTKRIGISNTYYKHNMRNVHYISGLCIPMDDDGITRNIHFINCTFHPGLQDHYYQNCEFTSCEGYLKLKK